MINTKIEWADDTVNFWWGCEKISPGCKNCYAQGIADRFAGDLWGASKPRLRINSAADTCRKLNRKAEKAGVPRLVFVNSMSDFFEEHSGRIVHRIFEDGEKMLAQVWYGPRTCGVDGVCTSGEMLMHPYQVGEEPRFAAKYRYATLADLRASAFRVMDSCPWLRFILLTKRPENILRMWPERRDETCECDCHEVPNENRMKPCAAGGCYERPNVWLLTSVENQEQADKRIPELLKCRGLSPVLGLSCEPLLGPVILDTLARGGPPRYLTREIDHAADASLDWVIAGGESGLNARPMHPAWARNLRDQCAAANVPFFFKQWGEWVADRDSKPPAEVPTKFLAGTPDEFTAMQRPKQSVRVVRLDGIDRVFKPDGKFTGDAPQQSDAWMIKAGKKNAGRKLDGREHNEFPVQS